MPLDRNDAWLSWQPSQSEPWDRRRAGHLVRRAFFGTTMGDLDRLVDQGLEATLDELFAGAGRESFDDEMRPMERVLSSTQDPRSLASWWLLRMSRTPCQFLEKMTLFWHGHFATTASKVIDPRAMLAQNRLLREHALGSFVPMVEGISKDVAMLVYLDSTDNRKTRPNENYARELMELFCLGPGNYTEADIKELARCFTGWEVRRGKFRFNANQHDRGSKTFLGKTGNFGGDEAVRIVLDHPASSRFLARKLINWLVVDDLPDDEFCEPVARTLRETDFSIGAAIRQILASRWFWCDEQIGSKVRGPVEMAIGLVRGLGVDMNMNQFGDRMEQLGQLPMFPPNVKGWEGGRQWINASTFIGRVNLVAAIVAAGNAGNGFGALARGNDSDAREWVSELVEWLVPVALPQASFDQIVEIAKNARGGLEERVGEVICAIGATPEFQLN